MAVSWAVTGQYDPLPDPCLSSCHDPSWKRQFCQRLYCIYLHPSYVDELFYCVLWHGRHYLSETVINGILTWLHLPKQNLINTPAAIVLGMVYNFLPFMVLPIYNVLAKIDDNTINAAKDLGANTLQTLFYIWLPLSLPGIISGITMVFVPSSLLSLSPTC